jgi:predicted lipoprotein with Yx(FWY)xxD motif
MSERTIRLGLGLPLVLVLAAACTSGGGAASASASQAVAPPSAASVEPSEAPSEAASEAPSAAAGATVEAKPVGSIGTVLVAGSNGLTVYNFTKDTKDSGTSACTGGCPETWPALTVPAGGTPTGGSGVTGTLGTITRADTGDLQVTYNGLPLYFFKNDQAPGDANGIYENWVVVKP